MKFLKAIFLYFIFGINVVSAQLWAPLGSGIDSYVYTVTANSDNNLIYAGGGGYVKSWDGNNWISVGDSLPMILVSSLTIYNQKLFAAEAFSGGSTTDYLYWLDDTIWRAFVPSPNSSVIEVVVDSANNHLYISGLFSQINGTVASSIAYWDGTNWYPLGSGLDNPAEILYFDNNGKLYAGGSFTEAGDSLVNYIAEWDGVKWSNMGSGMDDLVNTICSYNGAIYAGGGFQSAGGDSIKYFAKWNGFDWENAALGLDGDVYASCVYNGELYIGGDFTMIDGKSIKGVSRFDGTDWQPVGNGLNAIGPNIRVSTLYVFNDELYVAGSFDSAGGVFSRNIAKWTTPVSSLDNKAINSEWIIYPNPATGIINITTKQQKANDAIYAGVYDLTGKIVLEKTFISTAPLTIDISHLEGGMYHLQLKTMHGVVSKKIIKN